MKERPHIADNQDWEVVAPRRLDRIQARIGESFDLVAMPLVQLAIVLTGLMIWTEYPDVFPDMVNRYRDTNVVTGAFVLAASVAAIRGSMRAWAFPLIGSLAIGSAWLMHHHGHLNVGSADWYQWSALICAVAVIAVGVSRFD